MLTIIRMNLVKYHAYNLGSEMSAHLAEPDALGSTGAE